MPKLIADFDRAHVSSGLIVPIKAGQLFANWNTNFVEPEINQNDLLKFLKKMLTTKKVRFILQDIKSKGALNRNVQGAFFFCNLANQINKDWQTDWLFGCCGSDSRNNERRNRYGKDNPRTLWKLSIQ